MTGAKLNSKDVSRYQFISVIKKGKKFNGLWCNLIALLKTKVLVVHVRYERVVVITRGNS